MFDDNEPKPKPFFEIGQNLESLSVEELSATMETLKAEIERLEKAMNEKSAHLDAAAALFSQKK